MNDYERIAQIIRYLDRHQTDQPSLGELAGAVGLRPFHFHRRFSAWAGVTPKDFLQCLTLEHVKSLLQSENVLAAALDVGLSGPGRLHELCVSLEVASPGQIKTGGEGLRIVFGFADTPFGRCLVGESQRGICHLSFVEEDDAGPLQADWPNARLESDENRASRLAASIFVKSDWPALRAVVTGTAFQVRVWRALL